MSRYAYHGWKRKRPIGMSLMERYRKRERQPAPQHIVTDAIEKVIEEIREEKSLDDEQVAELRKALNEQFT